MSSIYAQTVGTGGGGKCRVYYSEKYKRKVIEKTLLINNFKNQISMIKEGIFMLMSKNLDCCVKFLEFKENPCRIIMEYCEGGDLRKVLDTYKMPNSDKLTIISQIILAVAKIHEAGIIHGDLKCQNIFLLNKYVPGDYKNIKIKIGDFGISELNGRGHLMHAGTLGFMAPEVPRFGLSFKTDVYALGKVMLEIMTQLPILRIALINQYNLQILKKILPKFLNVHNFYDTIIQCLSPDPDYRPPAKEIYVTFNRLVGAWFIYESMNHIVLQKYKIGDKVLVDSHPHSLILSNDRMRGYNNNWYCDICQNKDTAFFDNVLSFHCRTCKYDLCFGCLEKNNATNINKALLNQIGKRKEVYVMQHPHPLFLCGEEERHYGGGWICDICRKNPSMYSYSLHCKKCQYDVCLECYKKNFKLKEEKSNCSIW